MNDEKIDILSKIAFLSELKRAEIMDLAGDFKWETFPAGSVLFRQGQKPSALVILCEGKLEAEIHDTNDEIHSRRQSGLNQVYGELPLVTGKPSQYTLRCLVNSHVLSISAEDFGRILLRWPQIYRSIINQLSEDLNEANQMLTESRYKEVLRSAISLTKYRDKFYGIWGSVRTTQEVERKLEEIQSHQGHLLIQGERGTGRQMVAWYAHQSLFGELAPFVVVDGRRFEQQWGSMYHNLFDIALAGTLFIQEIDQISPDIQQKLAEALKFQNNKCYVIGSLLTQPKGAPQKIISELQECFAHTYQITPLRQRKRDIPILVQGILEKLAQKNHRNPPRLSTEATQLLLSHHYRQGNVTELIQVIERAFFLAKDDIIGLEQIFFGPTSEKIGRSINLLQWKSIENFFKKGTAIHWARQISAWLFILLIFGLLFAPQIMIATKVFTLVWGLWWPALAIISPFLGRVWCTICPFSTIMDFVQDKFHPKRRVPELLIKYDFLIVTALFLLIFWIETLSDMRSNPLYTGLLLIIIQIAAIAISILFPRHAWCHHFCPLGGFIGTASIGSILEVRADPTVCLNKCATLECYVGKGEVKGCPMSQHLPYLDNNLDCKLCFNCVRNCQQGSVQVNLRVPAREVWHLNRVNQGYTVFIGAMLAILFPLIYFEPLKETWPYPEWSVWFTIAYFASSLVGGVIAWWISKPFKTKAASKRIKIAFAFVPLVISGHIIYQLSFIPGIHDLVLGLGYQTTMGLRTVFMPAISAAQGIALLIGMVLTSLTVSIISLRKKTS